MNRSQLVSLVAVVAATGIIGMVGVDLLTPESISAWHTQFESKKDCTNFMKNTLGNSSAEANIMCNKVLPHE